MPELEPYLLIEAKDMILGDVVRQAWGDMKSYPSPFCDATVIKVTKDTVTLFRPFVHTSQMITGSNGGGYGGDEWRRQVSPYTGFEQYDLLKIEKGKTYALVNRDKYLHEGDSDGEKEAVKVWEAHREAYRRQQDAKRP